MIVDIKLFNPLEMLSMTSHIYWKHSVNVHCLHLIVAEIVVVEIILPLLLLNLTPYSVSTVSSVTQSCLTLCDPMNHSTPGLPVHHQLPEFTQMQVHQVSDAIQPSHPLSSPSPPAPNPS